MYLFIDVTIRESKCTNYFSESKVIQERVACVAFTLRRAVVIRVLVLNVW